MPVPNPYIIHIELFWPNGTRPNQNEIARVDAFESNWTWRGQCGWNPSTGGWMDLVVQNAPPLADLATLRFRVTSTAEQQVHQTGLYSAIPNGSTMKIIIGVSDELIQPVTPPFSVSGVVTNQSGGNVTDGTVEISDVTLGQTVVLGTVPVGSSGEYFLSFPRSAFENNGEFHTLPNLVAKYFDAEGVLRVQASPSGPAGQTTTINLVVPGEQQPGDRVVFGDVLNELRLPVAGLLIEAVHLAWTTNGIAEIPLGQAITDGRGSYEIRYSAPAASDPSAPCALTANAGAVNLLVYAKTNEDPPKELARSVAYFAAPPELRVDLEVDAISVTIGSEYTRLNDKIAPCLGNTTAEQKAFLEMLDSRSEYLACIAHSIQAPLDQLYAYVRARLITIDINTAIDWSTYPLFDDFDPEVTYALVRAGRGNTLSALLTLEPAGFYSIIVDAIEHHVVQVALEDRLRSGASSPLQGHWAEVLAFFLASEDAPGGEVWQAELLGLVLSDEATRTQVARAHYDFVGSFEEFIAHLEVQGILVGNQGPDLLFVFEVYELVDQFFPIVKALYINKPTRGWQRAADLAKVKLDGAPGSDWLTYAEQGASWNAGKYPGDVPGKSGPEKARAYAQRLFDIFGAVEPEVRFANDVAQAAAEEEDAELGAAAEFISTHEDFELASTPIDKYIADHGLTVDPGVVSRLKELQRVSRLTPKYSVASALIAQGYDSAVSIAQTEEADFVVALEPTIGLTDARAVHRKAKHYSAEVFSSLLRAHQKVVENGSMAVVPQGGNLQDLQETAIGSDKFPNWVTLFGALNSCASKHCQTVLSPGAYMTDLLKFIGDTPKNLLLDRRPDLVDIEVTCPNTDRVLSYIDLVIEALEAVLSPHRVPLAGNGPFTEATLNGAIGVTDPANANRQAVMTALANAGYLLTERAVVKLSVLDAQDSARRHWVIEDDAWRFRLSKTNSAADTTIVAWGSPQTSQTAQDLDVFPEHYNAGAAEVLSSAFFPFQLPLALGREETELLLSQRGTTRAEVLAAFVRDRTPGTPLPSESSLYSLPEHALAYLGLSTSEAAAAILSDNGGTRSVANYWGFQGTGQESIPRPESPKILVRGFWYELLAEMSVFLNRSQLSYGAMLDLLDVEYIHGGGSRIGIAASAEDHINCNYNRFQLTNLVPAPGDYSRLARINHFLRLQRLLGWDFSVLDRYLMRIEGGSGLAASLTSVSQFRRIEREWKLDPLHALVLFADLDRRRTERHPKSQFDIFYQHGSPTTPEFLAIERLAQGAAAVVIDEPPPGDGTPASSTDGFKSLVRGALRLSAADTDTLWTLVVDSSTTLTVSLLSQMARIAVFCRATRLSVEEYVALFITLVPGTAGAQTDTGLLGITPFPGGNDLQTRFDALFLAAEEVGRLRNSKVGVSLYEYLLRNRDADGRSLAPSTQSLLDVHASMASAAKDIADRYPDDSTPSSETLAQTLTEVMPESRVPRILETLRRDSSTPAAAEEPYFRRYLTFALREQTDTVLQQLLVAPLSPDERILALWTALRPELIRRARVTAALQVATNVTGATSDRIERLLTTVLTSVADPAQPALDDWIFGLGGFSTGDDVVDGLSIASPTTWSTGWIVPKDGRYRLVVAAHSMDAGAEAGISLALNETVLTADSTEVREGKTWLLFPELPVELVSTIARISLSYSGSLPISLMVKKDNDDPRLLGSGELSPFDRAAYLKLHKAVLLSDSLQLKREELVYLAERFDVLDRLPLDSPPSPSEELPWSALAPFLDQLALNRRVTLDATSLFREWLEEPLWPAGQVWDDARAARVSGFKQSDLVELRSRLWTSPPSYSAPETWMVLSRGMDALRGLKLTAEQTLNLIVEGEPNPQKAATLRDTLRSSYSEETWRKAFKPLRDKLRQKHRDALVGLLTDGRARGDLPQFVDANDLFSYFLIDVEMEPDVQLSRIKLALNVIQLFVQRVFMGLEGELPLYQLEKKKAQWTWMRNYRVWEANRKVFLWPENWIEPELRDDKSELFSTLEEQLLQDEVTPERATEMLIHYVEGMEEVAKLLVVGACVEHVYFGGTTTVLHIVARTRSTPYTYYHRTFDGAQFTDGYFSPWKKIPLEIDADTVAPVVVHGALHLAWPLVVEKGRVAEENKEEAVAPLVEIRFIWSKRSPENGKWSKPKASKEKVIDYEPVNVYHREAQDDKPITNFYHFRTASETDGTARFELIKTNDPTPIFPEFDERGRRNASRDGLFWSLSGTIFDILRSVFLSLVDARNEQNAYTRPKRLGIFTIAPDGTEHVANETLDLSLSANAPRQVTFKSNAGERFPWKVDGELPQNRYGLRGGSVLLSRVSTAHRTVSTNLGFCDTALNQPFFVETPQFSVFGVHRGTRRVPGLAGNVNQGVHFSTFNHPVMDDIVKTLRAKGPEGIMERLVQALPVSDGRYYYNYSNNYLSTSSGSYSSGYANKYSYYGALYLGYRIAGDRMARGVAQRDFEVAYQPTSAVQPWYPWPTVSFEYGTSMGIYNWELFFHVPLMIADRLTREMRFEEAMKWYHFIFDPRKDLNHYEKTKSWAYALPPGARYWNFLPFFANDEVDEDLLDVFGVTKGLSGEEREDLKRIISAWRNNPFNPHLVARQRISAYQKTTVMKYLDNLVAWGDQLFRRDTFESINEATQLYVLAAEILGDRPEIIEPVTTEPRYTYRELEAQRIDAFSNVLVEVESLLVGNSESVAGTDVDGSSLEMDGVQNMSIQSLYFSIPRNTKLDTYWDTVQDRLFKIRNSMNIDGVKRTLALFEPPIDPALLVKAAAAGLDLSTVISQLNRPQPHYRFRVWNQKAVELINEVKAFGGALLSALEKKDGEELALLRQGHELRMLKLAARVREDQIKEAEQNIVALEGSREIADARRKNYANREFRNSAENAAIALNTVSGALETTAGVMDAISGVLAVVPEAQAGAFSVTVQFGGNNLNNALRGIGSAIRAGATVTRTLAANSDTLGAHQRRQEDWDLQEEQAALEVQQIDQQIAAARIRAEIARKELANHEVQIEQSEEVQTFLQDKFSNKDLYQWMARELTRTYRQAYTLAYDVAKTAERTYRYELGLSDSDFIQFGYMDGPQGLLAGEKLGHDLRRMDIAYLEHDKREFEITKPISLFRLNPGALQTFRETGACEFSLPEVIFDLDFPGQYFRRIQAVRVTIPCVTGPYTSVSAKLSLLSSAIRTQSTASLDPAEYPYRGFEDPRFAHSVGGIQSIATSTAQDDAGLFELNFNDERYLPFEGNGVISRWRLELPQGARQFDYHTISDVVLNVSYTARDAGGSLKEAANGAIATALNSVLQLIADGSSETGLSRVFSMKREFPDALHRLLTSADRTTILTLLPQHFHYLLRDRGYVLSPFDQTVAWTLVTKTTPSAAPGLQMALGDVAPGTPEDFAPVDDAPRVHSLTLTRGDMPYVDQWQPEIWRLRGSVELTPEVVDDLLFTIKYTVPAP